MPDTQLLLILVVAMVAGVLLFRLYTVLGRRTGHEPPPPQPGRLPGAEAVALPPSAAAEPVRDPGGNGLLDIQLADRGFDTQNFLKGAHTAYEQIITAFHQGDRAALKPLLSPDVFAAFDAAINARATPAPAFVSLKDARIVGAAAKDGLAEITIAFTAGFSDGDVTDVWTFERRIGDENPNWSLAGTSGDLPE
jgi:predicted lipid-binding transport protein (Tim44 family)